MRQDAAARALAQRDARCRHLRRLRHAYSGALRGITRVAQR